MKREETWWVQGPVRRCLQSVKKGASRDERGKARSNFFYKVYLKEQKVGGLVNKKYNFYGKVKAKQNEF